MLLLNATPDFQGLISDLAFILLLGAIVTLLFKWIKQPVVLGYIVAGFLASPNFKPLPSVTSDINIEFWAQIGIIVLLFSLGLEFSFKKLLNTGGSAVVTALIIVVGMMATGFAIGHLLGFTTINSLFLGGMLSMSSTTIIIKAFTDLNLRQKKFASLVFAVLIVEDLFAVVMMVVLSSIAINNSVEGGEMLMSISKLIFFLVIWFLVGVYVLPSFLNKTRRFLNNETLLVVSMGLCLAMAVFSVLCGFSLALGAFVMGSILAGTSYAERIEHVTMPVKDLFGSVFFISVGMMVQPAILVEYWAPILLLSAVVIVGMILFGTFGMLVTGQSLKVAMESGFSLTQIGEFAFIIASLGMSLGVLNAEIYPIVVAVSVITTFTTPYFIRMADPAYRLVERHLPPRLHFLIHRYSDEATQSCINDSRRAWTSMLRRYLWRIVLYSIILIAITLVANTWLRPLLDEIIPAWSKLITTVVTLVVMAPFLLALILPPPVSKGNHAGPQPGSLKVPRMVIMVFRMIIALGFIVHTISANYSLGMGVLIGLAFFILLLMLLSRRLNNSLRNIETRFLENLNERDLRRSGKNNTLVSDLHLAYIHVGYGCPFVGERLKNSNLRGRYGIDVVTIQRGPTATIVPSGDTRLFPGDVIGVIGTDDQIEAVLPLVEADEDNTTDQGIHPGDLHLSTIKLGADSPLLGDSLASADVRRNYNTHVVALKRGDEFIDKPAAITLQEGDRLWIVAPDKHTAARLEGSAN
ncbi:MAG: cation:proton antiporter [Muribaculaceae bacterium]|nr:cation:proton antiporter [Muribaculaceae bacterium]